MVALYPFDLVAEGESIQEMAADDNYRVIPSPSYSELEQYAAFFNQDWKLLFKDFYDGTRLYIRNLPADRRRILALQLRRFLTENSKASSDELKRLWLGLGAQGWQSSLGIRVTLEEFCRIILGEPNGEERA